jgi:hypothetical protein
MVIANLVIGILWVFLAWWVFNSSRDLWIGITYSLIGIFVTLFIPLQLTLLGESLLFEQTRYIRAALLELGFTSRFNLSGVYIAVLGIASFLPRRAPA